MNRTELKTKIEMHQRELAHLTSIQPGCMFCGHYAMPECDKWNAVPPPDVVKAGCDEWTYDGIPF